MRVTWQLASDSAADVLIQDSAGLAVGVSGDSRPQTSTY